MNSHAIPQDRYIAQSPSDIRAQQPSRRTVAIALCGMIALCLGLSIFFFSTQSLRLDEAQSLWQSGRSPLGILTLVAQDVHVPLYHEILHMWRLFLGDSVRSARALSLLFYLLSIPALYLLGSRAYGRRVGLYAALLLSISPFMNWYGNEIRMYTLFLFLTILNQYFFLRIYQSRDDGAWLGYIVTAILGVYTHYFFFLNLAGEVIFYIWRQPQFPQVAFRRFIISAIITVLAFAPWIWYVFHLGQANNQEPLLLPPTTVNLFSTFSQFFFGFQMDNINTVVLSLWPIGIMFGFLTLRTNARIKAETEYFMLSAFVSFALAFGVSLIIQPLFVSRYLIFTIPSLFLMASSLLENYSPYIVRMGLIYLMFGMLAIEILNPQTPVKEKYQEATQYIQQHATAQDVVILSAPFTIYPVEYYYRGVAPISTIPIWNRYAYGPIPGFSAQNLPKEAVQLTQSHQEAWLLLSYNQGYEEQVRKYFDSHYQRVLSKNFSPDLTLYVYKLRYDTPLSQTPTARLN